MLGITPPIPRRIRMVLFLETKGMFVTSIFNKSEILDIGMKFLYL